jgi:hypothetical protein
MSLSGTPGPRRESPRGRDAGIEMSPAVIAARSATLGRRMTRFDRLDASTSPTP